MFPIQQYFTNYRKPLPRVLGWTFRNPSKTRLGTQRIPSKPISRNNSQSDTMSAVDAQLTNGSSSAHINGNGTPQPPDGTVETAIPFEPSVFRQYLFSIVPPLTGSSPDELITLFDDEFDERVTKFAQEGGGTLYVVKKQEDNEGVFDNDEPQIRILTRRSRRRPHIHIHSHFPIDLSPIPR